MLARLEVEPSIMSTKGSQYSSEKMRCSSSSSLRETCMTIWGSLVTIPSCNLRIRANHQLEKVRIWGLYKCIPLKQGKDLFQARKKQIRILL